MTEPGGGFVLLWRQIFEHPYWTEKRVFSRAEAWIDCWGNMAAYDAHRKITGGNLVELARGEFVASERFLEKRWMWSRGKVRRFFAECIEKGELERVSVMNGACSLDGTSGGTIYSVARYEDYQPRGTTHDTAHGPTTVPRTDQRETSKASKTKQLTTTAAVLENVDNSESVVDAIMCAANIAMTENPLTPNAEPILLSHASRQSVFDWLLAGVPAELIKQTVTERAKGYKPTGRQRQIRSMRYFDEAVLSASERKATTDRMAAAIPPESPAGKIKAGGPGAEMPRGGGNRRGELRHATTGEDPIEATKRAEQVRVAEWRAANPAEAERIWKLCRDDMLAKGMDALGERHFGNALEVHFRRRIIDEVLRPAAVA